MKIKIKNALYALLLMGGAILVFISWLEWRPVEIVAVHQGNNYSDILVRNFPFTDNGKIDWWLKNKAMLKEKYDVPIPDKNGFFSVIFWDFGEGYKETDGYDRLCFDDMKTKINCIDKEKLFSIWNERNNTLSFGVYDGEYHIMADGKRIKTAYK